MERCFLWMFAMVGFPTIDTSHTVAAHIPHTTTLQRHVFIRFGVPKALTCRFHIFKQHHTAEALADIATG
uniref:SFRICE_031370 n=1 Tax=Spodoptera frugiperda TaxID=7108 RepID=A0A2H1WHA0_SPOFR